MDVSLDQRGLPKEETKLLKGRMEQTREALGDI